MDKELRAKIEEYQKAYGGKELSLDDMDKVAGGCYVPEGKRLEAIKSAVHGAKYLGLSLEKFLKTTSNEWTEEEVEFIEVFWPVLL